MFWAKLVFTFEQHFLQQLNMHTASLTLTPPVTQAFHSLPCTQNWGAFHQPESDTHFAQSTVQLWIKPIFFLNRIQNGSHCTATSVIRKAPSGAWFNMIKNRQCDGGYSSSTEQNPYPTVFTLEQVIITFYGDVLNFLIFNLLCYTAILCLISTFSLAARRLLA